MIYSSVVIECSVEGFGRNVMLTGSVASRLRHHIETLVREEIPLEVTIAVASFDLRLRRSMG